MTDNKNNNNICKTVNFLLPLYIENRVNQDEKYQIEKHLSQCKKCFEKYLMLKTKHEEDIMKKNDEKDFFKNNLVAYVDDELNKEEKANFVEIITSNEHLRRELGEMIDFERKLKQSINHNRRTVNVDLSDRVMQRLKEYNYSLFDFYCKIAVILGIFAIISVAISYFTIFNGTNISIDKYLRYNKASEIKIEQNFPNEDNNFQELIQQNENTH